MPIDSPESLRQHIELAIQVELSTIPPYLYAMYSIADPESEAALLIRSIVAEEMLHAALATNLLLAVGGTPRYDGSAYMPTYPMNLPHHDPPLRLDLAPCSLELVENLFMRIERPEAVGAPAEPDEFETLGQFYHALELGLADLDSRFDLFSDANTASQMSNPDYYEPVAMDAEDSGGLMLVEDLGSAYEAIEIIVHQGEGLSHDRWADPSHQELTHYHKLLRIHNGETSLGEVHPLPTNPKVAEYPEDLKAAADLFNALYRAVFLALDRIFSGGEDQSRVVGVLYLVMGDLMSQVGRFLATREIADGMHAAPTFEMYQLGNGRALEEIEAIAQRAAAIFPELTGPYEAIHGLGLIL